MTRRRTMPLLPSVLVSLRQLVAKDRNSRRRSARSTHRALRIECCESRNLLASVSGTVFDDFFGDDFTPDDTPLGGVSVELFKDANANGQLDANVDLFISGTTSDPADGTYAFDIASDGRYFVRQVVPNGSQQTAGQTVYAFDVVDDRVYGTDTLTVDGFDAPDPAPTYLIAGTDLNNPTDNPLVLEQLDGAILGGRRIVTVEVLEEPGFTSASIRVGQGNFTFGTAALGTRALVQYGQIGATDLTLAGAGTGLRIDFLNAVNAAAATGIPLQIRATSPGGSAEFSGAIPNDLRLSSSHYVPFSAFTTVGGFSFTEVQQIEFEFNREGVLNVDFVIDAISAVNQQPFGYDFGNFTPRPDVQIEKATNGDDADTPTGPIVPVGSTITWTYEVTNPGNVPLDNVTVTDDSGVVLVAPLDANGLLDPGEVWHYETTLPAVVGQQASLASVSGRPAEGLEDVTDDDPTHYFGAIASIQIEKATNGDDADTPTGPIVPVGSTITWTYEVTNPGNVPLDNVTVTDDNGTPGIPSDTFSPTLVGGDTNDDGLLDPDEVWQYSALGQAALGQYTNVATVSGTPIEGLPAVTDDDPSSYFGAIASVEIEKAVNGDDADLPTGPIVAVDGMVAWTYEVTNTGNVPLANVEVTDDNGTPGDPADDFPVTLIDGDANGNGRLDLGEVWQYEATGTATAGQHASSAIVSGMPVTVGGLPIETLPEVSDDDPAHHFGAEASIEIEKATNGDDADTPTGPVVPVGSTVTWTYEVTNQGNVPLDNVTVTDDSGVVLGLPVDGDANGNGWLDPGEIWQYEATAIAAADQQASLASVSGTPVSPDGEPIEGLEDVTDDDPTHYFGAETSIQIIKATNGLEGETPVVPFGSTVLWTYDVTNPGNVPLENVLVTDDNDTPADPSDDFSPKLVDGDADGDGRLDPGETWHFTATDIAVVGTHTGVATAFGTPVTENGDSISGLAGKTAEALSGYIAEEPVTGSLSGFVYLDHNDDGIMSPGEFPLARAIITLDGLDLLNNPIHRTTLTDAAGFYRFSNLPAGKYTLRQTQPDVYVDGKDTAGTPGGTVANDRISNIVLPAGFHGQDNNFGERELKPEIISIRLLIYPMGNLDDYDGHGILPPENSTTVEGTPGDDLFEFTAGTAPGSLRLTLNGTDIPIGANIGAIHLDGLGGYDTVILSGTDDDETLSLGPDFAIFVGRHYAVTAVHVESVEVDGQGGEDRATLYDSAGDDTLKAWPGWATMEGDGYSHTVAGFEWLSAEASAGGIDTAMLYDSPGDDLLSATPTGASLSGDGFEIVAKFFEGVHAYATAGGIDVAKMFDSPGDDQFVAKPDYSALFGDGFYNRAKFFEGVHAYATAGGIDVARMYDSDGDDLFVADPTEGALFGDGFYNRAKFFEGVHAFGTAGGYDTARLYDSPGDDHFVLRPEDGALFGDQFYNRAKFFEQIEAHADAGGQDDASYEPVRDGHLEAADDWARLSWGGRFVWLTEFERVRAESSGDGNDTKHIEATDFLLLTDGTWLDI